ncbi:MAG: glycosyltransferase family 1 protein [Verrucomicrobia bacterium]|nr:glycosyltransferase family 1 protein [Verrucomicrobiota bacterium]
MKIVIDARWIFPELSGIGMYTREFLTELARQDTENAYTLLFHNADVMTRTIEECHLRQAANMRTELLPYGLFSARGQFALPRYLAATKADIFHTMNYMMPLLAFPRRRPHRTACIATIHDVIPLVFPYAAPRSRKAQLFPLYKRLMIEIGLRADAIITDSRSSREDIIRHMRIDRTDRIHVIYCGVSDRFQHPPPVPAERTPDRTRKVLYVGRADPYKNLSRLIRAFASARATLPFPVELTMAGSPDPRYPEPQAVARSLGVHDAIHWTGYISDDALLALYHSSDVLVHPSRYEGFGLQIAEAMACGLPVICSHAASLPEVAGDAAILLSPDDETGFFESLVDVLTDEARAQSLREKGFVQAGRFTWAETVRQTRAVYASLGSRREVPA